MILRGLSGQSTMIQKQGSLKTLDFLQLECYALSSPMHPLANAQADTTRTTLSCAATNITVLYFFKTLMCFLCMYRKQRGCWIIQVSFSVLCGPLHTVQCQFTSLLAVQRIPFSPQPQQKWLCFIFLMIAILNRMRWYLR